MDTNKQKEKNQLPLLTPKHPDGSQRIIKQIMVIDPNKLRVAGLDLKMAEALRKAKGKQQQTSHVPVGGAISRAQKVDLANALNKNKKQAAALTITNAIKKLPLLHSSPAPATDSQVKNPTTPITHSPRKTQTVVLNFLKGNQKNSTIEVNLDNSTSGTPKENVKYPKASLKPSHVVKAKPEIPQQDNKTIRTIESKTISPEVQFELKKRPPPAATKEQNTANSAKKLSTTKLQQVKLKANLEPAQPTPQKHLPTVIESKILSPAEKIDLSTLRVKSPTQLVSASIPLTLPLPAAQHRTPEVVEKPKQGVVTQDDAIVSTNKSVEEKNTNEQTDHKDQTEVKREANKPKRNWVRRASKTEAISGRLSPKPAAEESAVDFINFLFESKSKFESETKTVGTDATMFLRSLFGDQLGLSPTKTDETLQSESESNVSEYPRRESLRHIAVEEEVKPQDETPKKKSHRRIIVIENSINEKDRNTSAASKQQISPIAQTETSSNISESTQKESLCQMSADQNLKQQDETLKRKSQQQFVALKKSVTETNQQSVRKKESKSVPKEETISLARIENKSQSFSENVTKNPTTSDAEIMKHSPSKREKNATATSKEESPAVLESDSKKISETISIRDSTTKVGDTEKAVNEIKRNSLKKKEERTSEVSKEKTLSTILNVPSVNSSSTDAHKPEDAKLIAKLPTNELIENNLKGEGNLQESKDVAPHDSSIVQKKLEETSSSSSTTTNTRRKSKKSVPVIVAKLSRNRKSLGAADPKKLTTTSSDSNVSIDISIPSSSKEDKTEASSAELKHLDNAISIEELSQTQKKPLTHSDEEKVELARGAKETSTPKKSGTNKTRNSVSESKLECLCDIVKTEKTIACQSSESVSTNFTDVMKPTEESPLPSLSELSDPKQSKGSMLSKTTEPTTEDGTVELNVKASGYQKQHRAIETISDTHAIKQSEADETKLFHQPVIAEDSLIPSTMMTSVILPQQPEIDTKSLEESHRITQSDNKKIRRSRRTDKPTTIVDAVLSNDMSFKSQSQQATTDTISNPKPVKGIIDSSVIEDRLSPAKTTENLEKPSAHDSKNSPHQTIINTSNDTKVVESSQPSLLRDTETKQSLHSVITEKSTIETDDPLHQEAVDERDTKLFEALLKTKTITKEKKPSRRSTSSKVNDTKEILTVKVDATESVSIHSAQQTITESSSDTKISEISQENLLKDIGTKQSPPSVIPKQLTVDSDDQPDTDDTKPVGKLSMGKAKLRETKSPHRSTVVENVTQFNELVLTNPTQEQTNDAADVQSSLQEGTGNKQSAKTNEIAEDLTEVDSKGQSKEITQEKSSQQREANKSNAKPIEETLQVKANTTKLSHSTRISESLHEISKTDAAVNVVRKSIEETVNVNKEPDEQETGARSSTKSDEPQISRNLETIKQSVETTKNPMSDDARKESSPKKLVRKSKAIEPVGIAANLTSGDIVDKSDEENSTNPSNQQKAVQDPTQEVAGTRRSRRSTPIISKVVPSSGIYKKNEQQSGLNAKAIDKDTIAIVEEQTRTPAFDLGSANTEIIENVKSTDAKVEAKDSPIVTQSNISKIKTKECTSQSSANSTPIESPSQHQNIEVTSKSVELLTTEKASEESKSVSKTTKKPRTKPKPILTTERKVSSRKAADGGPIKQDTSLKTNKFSNQLSQEVETKGKVPLPASETPIILKSVQSTDVSSTLIVEKISNKTETLPTDHETCTPTSVAVQGNADDIVAVNPGETPKGSNKKTRGRKKTANAKLSVSSSEEAVNPRLSLSKESEYLSIDSLFDPSPNERNPKDHHQNVKDKKNVEPLNVEVSPTEDISQISDYSDAFEDCDTSDLIDASISAEKTLENQSNKPVSIFDAIKEKPSKQGKAKNPFRKAKPSSNVEQTQTNEHAKETDFLGFNDKEIEEGHKSTSLRLSQSTENLSVSPSTSDKKKGSPRIKKSPLSAGKKQKQEQQAWKKNSAATLKSWLKKPDGSPEPFKEDNQGIQQQQQTSTPKPRPTVPPKKRRKKQEELNSSVEVNTVQDIVAGVVENVEVKQTSEETTSKKRRSTTSVKLSDKTVCKTPQSSRSKRGKEKSPRSTSKRRSTVAKAKEEVIKNEPTASTPIKPTKGSRKRPAPEPFTPGTEPPTKISHLSDGDIPIPTFTLPSPKPRGRRPKTGKSSYIPVVPVNPLEKKYKNDTEFNPRLLLVRKKEELKSDEPLVDPDLQTVPKNPNDVQCALCLGYTTKKNWIRHLSTHYGVGWVMGNPPPVNIKSRCSILNYMIEFFKGSGIKGLECRICKGLRRSALGLLVHIEQCVLTEKEIEESRVICEYCKNNYSRMSMPSHIRTCSAKPEPEQEVKEPADENENDVLSNTGRVKRKSVIKAEHNFKEMNEIEFNPEEFIKFIPQPQISLPNWQRDIQTFGKGFCVWKQCSFTAETMEELQAHCAQNVCPFYTNAIYKCIKCKFRSENNEATLNHVKLKHNPNPAKDFEGSSDDAPIESESSSSESDSSGDDESESGEGTDVGEEDGSRPPKRKKVKKHKTKRGSRNRKPKKGPTKDFKKLLPERSPKIASKVAKWYDSFLKENYTGDALFVSATPKIVQTNDDGFGPYFPKSALSMKFQLQGFNGFVKQFGKANIEPGQWQQLERFKGKGLPNEHILFVGGPVKRIAWAPLEPLDALSTQYLAVSTRKDIEKYTRFIHPKLSRSLIYIQKYDISASTELRGEILYALAIDAGPVHCIEFMPSGGYAPNINRLGLLVVGTVETEIKVYSLPLNVAKKDCDMFPIVRLEPSFVLTLEVTDNPNGNMDNYQTQCVDLVWSQTSGHNYIIGGFVNGFVGIWDISDEEDNLNRFCENGVTKFVPVSYFWTMESRLKYVAAHYDLNGLRWLLVCNETRKLLMYDLREINKPILFYVETMRNICTGLDWPVVWENPSCSLGDASPSYGCCINTISPLSLVYNNHRLDKFCCGVNDLHFNPWKNLYAGGAENGDLQITSIREAHLDVSLRKKSDEKIVSSLDIARFDSEDLSNQTLHQKLQDGYRIYDHDYQEKYGVIFGEPEKIKGTKAPKLYDPKRIVSINLSRLMRINCLRFNPNRNSNNLLAVGYNNGFLRILQSDWAKMLGEPKSNS